MLLGVPAFGMALMTLWTANRWPCFSIRKIKKAVGEYGQAAMTQVLASVWDTVDEDSSKSFSALAQKETDMKALLGTATKGIEEINSTTKQIEESYKNSDKDLKAAIDQANQQVQNRTALAQQAFDKALADTQ